MGYGLGRRHAPDRRDRNFLMRAAVTPEITRKYRYWNDLGWWGDQGEFPHCVGFSLAHYLENAPVTHPQAGPHYDPVVIYDEAQKVDEWEGSDYDGTSVRAGAKVLQSAGLISEYRWAFDLRDVIYALVHLGPVVVGTNWYAGMFKPDDKGYLRTTGSVEGGHAYLLTGVYLDSIDPIKGRVRVKNSWGRTWGRGGRALLDTDTLGQLLAEDGEMLIAQEAIALKKGV